MCYPNGEEIKKNLKGWLQFYAVGTCACYTATNSLINIETSLVNIKKASAKDFRLWATTRNAEVAAMRASCPWHRGFIASLAKWASLINQP